MLPDLPTQDVAKDVFMYFYVYISSTPLGNEESDFAGLEFTGPGTFA